MSEPVLGILRFIREAYEAYYHKRHQKQRLKMMLNDKRFAKGFRSIEQLAQEIGANKDETERLLVSMGARKSEVSDEWTLN